jgi:YidC/Oxa1 family membrane protein insertase
MTDQKNLILAIVFSVGIILLFQVFYEMPRMREEERIRELQETAEQQSDAIVRPAPSGERLVPGSDALAPGMPEVGGPASAAANRTAVLEQQPRVAIDNGRVHGSIVLEGGRIDDITLADYRQTIALESPEVELLNPAGTRAPYFAEFGWVTTDGLNVPDAETLWQEEGSLLTADDSLSFRWDNGEGLVFKKRISLDPDFMFHIERSVENTTDTPVTLYPYSLLTRWPTPETMGFFILHEGPIGVLDGTLKEIDYDDLIEGPQQFDSTGGWVGFTDKYWLGSLIPDQSEPIEATFRHTLRDGQDRYQIDYLGAGRVIPAGGTVEVGDRLFAGAKEVTLLDSYSERYGIPLFDRAVDFGWFYFLTKPIFYVLTWLYALLGNYGLAILALTLIVKLLFFPLANKSYRSMSQMKKLQPEMVKLRERYGDDKQKMQQELMALYKREKVNPVAGCLPIIVQIPVFFALYKVLFVSIEMRHAPFFGWIKDLSAPDPTSLFNLFGLLPFDPPGFLMIGVWPLIMGVTMWLQFRLNPQPADPIQAKVMSFLPLIFVFLFATFPAGLVIYWTWNNILSIAQQWLIMKRMGVKAG